MTTDTIRQLLSHPDGYRRDAWRDFLKALFPTAEIFAAPQPLTHPGEELPDGFQLGRAMLADGRRIAFIEQPVPASTNLMRNRVGLRNRIARLIDRESATGVLAIFTDAKDRNFRLSFVARESSLTFTDEGTQTTKTETAPKRFTYYLGPDEACRTAAQRFELLLKLGAAASLPDLIDAFSVEKLNKEFFNDFSRRVSDIAAGLETTHPDWSHDTCRTEAQTLLNRLVFLYFVQRKGWLNRSRTFLTDAFKPHADQPGCTFFRTFLGPLFECLSTEPSLAPTFPHDVPFLNGGLFSDEAGADDPDIQRRRSLDVSNAVFRTVFQDLLDRYNFTIVEDSPSSVEVAIDPEMLGRVFEALVLQREESDTGGKSRRHDTGSHYTPRPIVHYLCREALAGWLENQPPFSGQPDARLRIDGLLALDASEGLDEASQRKLEKLLTAEEAAALARLLLALRMCDPAVGSGAFPLGFLHEMLNVIRLCETRSCGQDPAEGDPTWLYETKKQIIEQVIYGVDLQVPAIELCKLRLWLSLMVDHELKADPFKCSQSAFQKALRQLEPLPNLDFKIRAVNSLLELFHGQRLRLDAASLPGDARNHITALTKAKHQFYAASKVQEKRSARLAIHGHYAALILLAIAQERGRYTARLRSLDQADLARLHALTEAAREADLILKLATSAKREKASAQDTILRLVEEKLADPAQPSFLWHFDFAEVFFRDDLPEQGAAVQAGSHTLSRASKGQMELTLGSDVSPHGFDLVLGNPPYIRIQTLKKSDPELADYFKQRFHSASKGNYDLYVCFVERGLELLHAHGQLAYILPHKFFNAQYGQPLRELISKDRQLRHVVHFGDQQIFPGATNYVCLLFLAKAGIPSCRFVFDDEAHADMEWKPDDDAHSEHPLFHAMVRSRGWMDYRTLWNALDFKPTRDHADIFDSLAETLLTDTELPAVSSQTFGELWKRIKETVAEKPTTNHYTKYYLERLQADIGLFEKKLRDFLPALQERTNELLQRFVPWTSVTLKLERAPVYDSSKRIRTEKFTHGTVSLRATYRGQPLKRLDGFLNEARITAIALSLFLAALTLSTPPKLADGTYFPRLLVLDDILISLDMAHRRPLLEILNEKFADWQVILLTHDRAWYEMAKTQLRPGKWKCMELFAVPFGDYERPLIKEDVNHLERARNFLADGEIKAAAVHVRTKFELVLKEACRELRLRVVYVDDPKRWDANHFWDTFQARLKPDPATPKASDADNLKLIADVSHSLSWVLNPHSHSRPVDHIRLEIKKAVESVAELERTVRRMNLAQKDLALQKATSAQVAANAALAALSSP